MHFSRISSCLESLTIMCYLKSINFFKVAAKLRLTNATMLINKKSQATIETY